MSSMDNRRRRSRRGNRMKQGVALIQEDTMYRIAVDAIRDLVDPEQLIEEED